MNRGFSLLEALFSCSILVLVLAFLPLPVRGALNGSMKACHMTTKHLAAQALMEEQRIIPFDSLSSTQYISVTCLDKDTRSITLLGDVPLFLIRSRY